MAHCRNYPSRQPEGVSFRRFAPALILLAIVAGCSGEPQLSGSVVFDGKPLADAQVTFVSDGLPTAYAVTAEDGSYRAKVGASHAIKAGTYRVSIAAYELLPSKNPYAPPPRRLITPAKYETTTDSGLTVEVKQGGNTKDFELESEYRNQGAATNN